jgi:hypothetical protein
MKRLALPLALICLVGCDSKPATDTKIDIPEVSKEVNDGVKDVLNKRAPKWVIDYSGDVKGTIQGGIMTAVSLSSATKVGGAAMSKDMKGKAAEGFMLTILTVNSPPTATMAMTLPDGTKCTDAKASTVNIIDKESKTFKAEAAGNLVCGAKKISYTAKMNKKP